jgi:hypothetical protein
MRACNSAFVELDLNEGGGLDEALCESDISYESKLDIVTDVPLEVSKVRAVQRSMSEILSQLSTLEIRLKAAAEGICESHIRTGEPTPIDPIDTLCLRDQQRELAVRATSVGTLVTSLCAAVPRVPSVKWPEDVSTPPTSTKMQNEVSHAQVQATFTNPLEAEDALPEPPPRFDLLPQPPELSTPTPNLPAPPESRIKHSPTWSNTVREIKSVTRNGGDLSPMLAEVTEAPSQPQGTAPKKLGHDRISSPAAVSSLHPQSRETADAPRRFARPRLP